jgi:hypothetical protein
MCAGAVRGVGRGGRVAGKGRRVDSEGLWREVGGLRVEGVNLRQETGVEGVWHRRHLGAGRAVVLVVDGERGRAVCKASNRLGLLAMVHLVLFSLVCSCLWCCGVWGPVAGR